MVWLTRTVTASHYLGAWKIPTPDSKLKNEIISLFFYKADCDAGIFMSCGLAGSGSSRKTIIWLSRQRRNLGKWTCHSEEMGD